MAKRSASIKEIKLTIARKPRVGMQRIRIMTIPANTAIVKALGVSTTSLSANKKKKTSR